MPCLVFGTIFVFFFSSSNIPTDSVNRVLLSDCQAVLKEKCVHSPIYQCPCSCFGRALECYQCDSTLNSNCQEMWDHSLSVNEQTKKKCNLWDAKYCIKVTGMWGGVVGTHRFCSSRDMGDQCQDIWFPDHDRMYRACVYTCDSDGCNSASTLKTTTISMISTTCFITAVVAFFRRMLLL